jgi:anti-anti-sigma factor
MSKEVRHRIASLLRCGERQIVLDLKHMPSIDAAGVGELVRAHNMARAVGATVLFVNPNVHVRELITRVGLGDVLLTDDVAAM